MSISKSTRNPQDNKRSQSSRESESSEARYRELILSFAEGETPKSKLPVGEPGFWEWACVRAARPGRRSTRAPNIGTAAERLLSSPLVRAGQIARQRGAIAALSRPDPRVRRTAIQVLRDSDDDAEVFDAGARAIHDSDAEVRTAALFLLSERASVSNLPMLFQVLRTTSDLRAAIAMNAITRIGADAAPGLVALLDSDDARIRWRSALALSRLHTDQALDGLIKAFHDDDPNVAWVAADGLLALGARASKDVLRSVLEHPISPVVRQALHHYAEHVNPRTLFKPLSKATVGLGAGAATLTTVERILEQLESGASENGASRRSSGSPGRVKTAR